MRILSMFLPVLAAALLLTLFSVQSSEAETVSERNTIHKKYQTSVDSPRIRGNEEQEQRRYEKRRARENNRRGEELVWRDYQGYSAKHYRIQEQYGGYSASSAIRAGQEYRSERRDNQRNRQGSYNRSRGQR